MMETKQVIVIRKDLGMRKGKMIAQGAHASTKNLVDQLEMKDWGPYVEYTLLVHKNDPLYKWLSGPFAKIVVSVDSEEELFEIKRQVEDAGIPVALITDLGRTEFHGEPTNTSIAIGPYNAEEIDKITGHLKLL